MYYMILLICIIPPPKYNKLVNIIKAEQTHRYRKQIRSYQHGEADSQIQRTNKKLSEGQ